MYFTEEITRNYSNMVKIVYEIIDEHRVYIHSIISNIQRQGNATQALQSFLEEYSNSEIYLYASNELGTSKEVLDIWYKKLGFEEIECNDLPYNVTHFLRADIK